MSLGMQEACLSHWSMRKLINYKSFLTINLNKTAKYNFVILTISRLQNETYQIFLENNLYIS